MTLAFIRWLFLIICGVVGYYVALLLHVKDPLSGVFIGLLCGLILIFIEFRLRRVSVRGLSSVVFGLLLGIFMAKMIANILALMPLDPFISSISELVLTLVFSYLGAVMALRGKDEFNVIIPYVRFKRQDLADQIYLIDSSAIIDGRVFEIFRIKSIEGRMVVPRFILQELQKLADSADDLKRQKGRRALELLRNIQSDSKMDLHIHEDELTGTQSADEKLVILAKTMDARICTTDFNLSQRAFLQGVNILNIQELANSLRPVLFVGDVLDLRLVKEGKDHDQAVGFLDDGTMVVVVHARSSIGQNVKVQATSILQTQTGKMIFAKLN